MLLKSSSRTALDMAEIWRIVDKGAKGFASDVTAAREIYGGEASTTVDDGEEGEVGNVAAREAKVADTGPVSHRTQVLG